VPFHEQFVTFARQWVIDMPKGDGGTCQPLSEL
jgi:hypothetical protein